MKLCLWKHLSDVCEKIQIIDVGAMAVGGDTNVYERISGISTVIGFEPDMEECEKLNYNSGNNQVFFPHFIGDGTTGTFRKCNQNMTSSFYEPDTELLKKFQCLEELTRVETRTEEKTKRLDFFEEIADADYLKVDAQGSEVDIFNGADKLLTSSVLVVHTEVCFIPLYKGQPLFAEIDQSLREKGFLFHKFANRKVCGRAFRPMRIRDKPYTSISQMMWTDAIYVKNFMDFDSLPDGKLLKLAIILHDVYQSYDMANLALESYDKKNGSELSTFYKNSFTRRIA